MRWLAFVAVVGVGWLSASVGAFAFAGWVAVYCGSRA